MENQIVEVYGKKYEVILVPVEEVKEVEPKRISGFFVDIDSNVRKATDVLWNNTNKDIFRTEEQAEACIAMAQLSQLMFEANDGWVPDWDNSSESKYVILFERNKISKGDFKISNTFLSFKTYEIRDKFLEENEQLILTAKPLIS